MITPQIIHTEPDHPALHHPSLQQSSNAEMRNLQSYPNSISYNTTKSESDFRQQGESSSGRNSGESSTSSSQKKPKKEIDSSKPYKW